MSFVNVQIKRNLKPNSNVAFLGWWRSAKVTDAKYWCMILCFIVFVSTPGMSQELGSPTEDIRVTADASEFYTQIVEALHSSDALLAQCQRLAAQAVRANGTQAPLEQQDSTQASSRLASSIMVKEITQDRVVRELISAKSVRSYVKQKLSEICTTTLSLNGNGGNAVATTALHACDTAACGSEPKSQESSRAFSEFSRAFDLIPMSQRMDLCKGSLNLVRQIDEATAKVQSENAQVASAMDTSPVASVSPFGLDKIFAKASNRVSGSIDKFNDWVESSDTGAQLAATSQQAEEVNKQLNAMEKETIYAGISQVMSTISSSAKSVLSSQSSGSAGSSPSGGGN